MHLAYTKKAVVLLDEFTMTQRSFFPISIRSLSPLSGLKKFHYIPKPMQQNPQTLLMRNIFVRVLSLKKVS